MVGCKFRATILLIDSTLLSCSFEVARSIRDSSYGLVFGFNTFLALLFQTTLTIAVADEAIGLALPPRQQGADSIKD